MNKVVLYAHLVVALLWIIVVTINMIKEGYENILSLVIYASMAITTVIYIYNEGFFGLIWNQFIDTIIIRFTISALGAVICWLVNKGK